MNDLRHTFPGQEPDEVVYILTRPHFVSFLPNFFVFLFVEFIALFAQYIAYTQRMGVIVDIVIVVLGLFSMFSTIVYFVMFIDDYYDLTVVTNDRLVDIDQEQLFYRKISELSLTDIQDVSSTVKGFLPSMFDYGNVFIQTAGEKTNFHMLNIGHPREVAAMILDLADQAEKKVDKLKRSPRHGVAAVIEGKIINRDTKIDSSGLVSGPDYDRLIEKQKDDDVAV